jgi:ankyrin repeat protein
MTIPNLSFDLSYRNGGGNTVLHLAIKTGQLKFVKLVLLKLAFLDSACDEDQAIDPETYNMRTLRNLSSLTNQKGFTPLLMAVDSGSFPIFRALLELSFYHDATAPDGRKLLQTVLRSACSEKGETPLLKAARLNHLEMVFSLLNLIE